MTYVPMTKSFQPCVAGGITSQTVTGFSTLALAFASGMRETSYAVTLNQNCTITVGPGAMGIDQLMTIDLIQGGSGGCMPSFTNVSWSGGISPSFNMSPGKQDMVQLRTVGSDVMGWPVSMGRLPLVASLPTAPASVTVLAGTNQNVIGALAVTSYPAVLGYNVYSGPTAGGESAVPIASNVSLPYVDSGLAAGVTRFYKVAAVNSIGVGTMSLEASGTPTTMGSSLPLSATPLHYATFTTTDSVFYANPNSAFNPGGNPFDMQVNVRMADWTTSGYGGSGETCLWGCWDINGASRLWRLGLTTGGAIRASWATGAVSDPTAVSSATILAAGGTDLWIRAAVTPLTGLVTFYTSVDGSTWTQLGTQQTATSSGGVYTPASLPYLVIGSNASGEAGGNTAEQFAGRFYEARLYINGLLVTDPLVGAGGVTDSKGVVYSKTAGVGIV